MKKRLVVCCVFFLSVVGTALSVFGQGASIDLKTDSVYQWPYALPIWGDKLAERNISFPLPVGVNVNYINSKMDLEITNFGMSLGDDQVDLTKWLNEETLGFRDVEAGVSGVNTRVDAWVLPFMNVYGMFSWLDGYTDVTVAPRIDLSDFDQLPDYVQLPSFSSRAEFDAIVYGFGATFSYGVNNWFYTLDMNRSWTSSDILNNDIGISIVSFRMGHQFRFKKEMKLAVYAGVMRRNFTNDDAVDGRIVIGEVFPNGEAQFDAWYAGLTPFQQRTFDRLRDPVLDAIGNESFFEAPVDYTIRKELVQEYTFQMGFSFDLTRHWSYRAELGISKHQTLLITGANYRFGITKKRN